MQYPFVDGLNYKNKADSEVCNKVLVVASFLLLDGGLTFYRRSADRFI